MFERYTEASRQVVVRAQEAARELDHNYIGTEHILLALTLEPDQIPALVLAAAGITAEQVRSRLIAVVGLGEHHDQGQIPFTPRTKKILELSLRESLSLGHLSIRPGHLLLGLLREGEGVAARILMDLDVSTSALREQVIERLAQEHDEPPPPSGRLERPSARFKHSLRRIDGPSDIRFVVEPDGRLQRLLMAAAGRALSDQRQEFGLGDLLAVAREDQSDAHQPSDDDS